MGAVSTLHFLDKSLDVHTKELWNLNGTLPKLKKISGFMELTLPTRWEFSSRFQAELGNE